MFYYQREIEKEKKFDPPPSATDRNEWEEFAYELDAKKGFGQCANYGGVRGGSPPP